MKRTSPAAIERCTQFLGQLSAQGVISIEQNRMFRSMVLQDNLGPNKLISAINATGGISSKAVSEAFARMFSVGLWGESDGDRDLLRVDEMMVITASGRVYFENPLDQRSWDAAVKIAELYPSVAPLDRSKVGIISRDEHLNLIKTAGSRVVATKTAAAEPSRSSLSYRQILTGLLQEAIAKQVTDLHVDPDHDGAVLRHRIGGELRSVRRIDSDEITGLASTIHEAHPKGSEAYLQEATEVVLSLDGAGLSGLEVRVDTIMVSNPAMVRAMPKLTLHLRSPSIEAKRLNAIGLPQLPENNIAGAMRRALSIRSGLILIVGPQGCGKTSTLASLMGELQRIYPQRSRVVVEVGNELALPGINHIDAGVSSRLAETIGAVRRHGADEIYVGALDTIEAVRAVFDAVGAGQLVFATLEASSIRQAISRLRSMGAAHDEIAEGLEAVLAQRLARRVCHSCSSPETWDEMSRGVSAHYADDPHGMTRERYRTAAEALGKEPLFFQKPSDPLVIAKPGDCVACGGSGYSGRLLIAEMLVLNTAAREAIADGRNPASRQRDPATGQYNELWIHGIQLIRERSTTLDEVYDVLGTPPKTQKVGSGTDRQG